MVDEKQLEILKQGVPAWNRWRNENPDVRIHLSGAGLGWLDLKNILLREAKLDKADLVQANLRARGRFTLGTEAALLLFAAALTACSNTSSDVHPANVDLQDAGLDGNPQSTLTIEAPVIQTATVTLPSGELISPEPTNTATAIPEPVETQYIEKVPGPGFGGDFYREFLKARKRFAQEEINAGVPESERLHGAHFGLQEASVMITDKESFTEMRFLMAIENGDLNDPVLKLEGLPEALVLITYNHSNHANKTIEITPEIMKLWQQQRVAVIFGFGDTKDLSGNIIQNSLPTSGEMVSDTRYLTNLNGESQDEPILGVMFGGSDKDILDEIQGNRKVLETFAPYAEPQSVTIDLSRLNLIIIVPLDKESLKQVPERNGFGGRYDYTKLTPEASEEIKAALREKYPFIDEGRVWWQVEIVRGDKSMAQLLKLP